MAEYTADGRGEIVREMRAYGDANKGEFVSEEVNQLKADVVNIFGASRNSVRRKLAELIETAPGAASTDSPATTMDLLETWMERAAKPDSCREKASANAGENTVGE